MEGSKEHNQSFFTLLTSLSPEEYGRAESLFSHKDAKNCSISHQKRLVDKL